MPQIDMQALFEITMRVLSEDTVEDARDFVDLVTKAAEIVKKAGLRILGIESRSVREPYMREIQEVVASYNESDAK